MTTSYTCTFNWNSKSSYYWIWH